MRMQKNLTDKIYENVEKLNRQDIQECSKNQTLKNNFLKVTMCLSWSSEVSVNFLICDLYSLNFQLQLKTLSSCPLIQLLCII